MLRIKMTTHLSATDVCRFSTPVKRAGLLLMAICPMLSPAQSAGDAAQPQDTLKTHQIENVTVTARRSGTHRINGVQNGLEINRDELFRAACCNLGESFETNPSVDVNYSDAATGAKQIKLLGLPGTYVQMLTENMPNYRNTALAYGLGYVPGPWMKSIQVSKGCSSVKNGYESITGQINIQFLQPEDDEGVSVNLYGNTMSKMEVNAEGNINLADKLSTELLLHHENQWGHHDKNNDGFMDEPNTRQWNLMNRWAYQGDRYIFHGGIGGLKEKRTGGTTSHHTSLDSQTGDAKATSQVHGHAYPILVETDRAEAYMKHALVLNREHATNLALMASGSFQDMTRMFGTRHFDTTDRNLYASLMYESNLTEQHNLSAGLSLNHDHINTKSRFMTTPEHDEAPQGATPSEAVGAAEKAEATVFGGYAQYTFNLKDRLTIMAGLRADHAGHAIGWFVTPRLHAKWVVTDWLTLRGSAGKGNRIVMGANEFLGLFVSNREVHITFDYLREESWNYGLSSAFTFPVLGHNLRLNAEYYYTHFDEQAVVNMENPGTLLITPLSNKPSFSHTAQVDATYEIVRGLSVTAAYRWNDVRCSYLTAGAVSGSEALGHKLMQKPLTSRYKALLSASYKTPLEVWQFDATLQLNGGGRLPIAYDLAGGDIVNTETRFHSYEQLSAQVTRWFRHFSVYVGAENLTDFSQKRPVLFSQDPANTYFDPTLVWGPTNGRMFYAGIRLNFGKRL